MKLRGLMRVCLWSLCICPSAFSQVKTAPPFSLPGTDGKIATLAYHQGILYVGGEFTLAGSTRAANIAKWNGRTWSSVGEGYDRPVTKLACDSKGMLYAAGYKWKFGPRDGSHGYTIELPGNIMAWNGETWRTLGTLNSGISIPGAVTGMAFDSQGRLFVSGSFESVDTTQARSIAWWDGSGWHRIGDGQGFPLGPKEYSGDAIRDIVVDKSDVLYGLNLNRVSTWTSASGWTRLGDTLSGYPGALFLDGNGLPGSVGRFRYRNIVSGPLALYRGKAWQYPIDAEGFRGGTSSSGNLVYLHDANAAAAGPDGMLFVATSSSVFTVKGSEMRPLGYPDNEKELHGQVLALLVDPNGHLYAAGQGLRIGSSGSLVSIARWDGRRWSLLESAVHGGPAVVRPASPELPENLVLPEGVARDKISSFAAGSDGQFFISGNFRVQAGEDVLNRLARWDGSAWRAVGPGLSARAVALAADRFGNLYAAGRFRDGEREDRLLRWDGAAWQGLSPPNGNIRSLACDASGYLYIGTSGLNKDVWPYSLTRWDDRAFTLIEGAPSGRASPFEGAPGSISQLDIIDTLLHVQGDFNKAGGRLTSGYAAFRLPPPDKGRIRSKSADMRRNASNKPDTSLAVRLLSSECRLGTRHVFRLERLEIENRTAKVFDSVVFHAPDSSGFQAEAIITAEASGFRIAFPLGRFHPLDRTTLVVGRTLGRVAAGAEDTWVYRDTLTPLLYNPALQKETSQSPVFRIAFVDADTLSVIRGASRTVDIRNEAGGDRPLEVTGKPGTVFQVEFARSLDADPVARSILDFIHGQGLFNEYLPPPVSLLAKADDLSKAKKDLLGRELLEWVFSFEKPVDAIYLYDLNGEGEDTVPKPAELKRRFMDIARLHLGALAVVKPFLGKETLAMIPEWIGNWRPVECADQSMASRKENTDFVICGGELGFYPMALIEGTLKLLGPTGKKDLDSYLSKRAN